MTLSRLGVTLTVVALAVALAGCTADSVETSTATAGITGDESVSSPQKPTQSSPSDDGTPADGPTHGNPDIGFDASPTCEGTPGLLPASNDVQDRVGGYLVPVIRDEGASRFASGDTVVDDAGAPVAYVVAAGDTASAIADRFCIGYVPYLGWVNSIRRNGVERIYAGDTLNLDRFAIRTTGDENGIVYNNVPGIHIPPQ